MKKKISHPYALCLTVFAVCAAARIFEYYVLRTDQSPVAENFLHKLFGIAVLAAVLKITGLALKDIGFVKKRIADAAKGLCLGAICFAAAYSAEMLIHLAQGSKPYLDLYATGFSLDGSDVRQTGAAAVLLCILFNIINVLMEEGVFRGLFLTVTKPVSGMLKANLFAALLFGVWHWVMPMRSFTDGESSLGNLIVMGVGYVILSGIMSIKWGMMMELGGSLWTGLGDHLFNNVVATNLLHVVANGEADSLQIVRILLAQLLSFFAVLFVYLRKTKSKTE